MFSQKWDIPHPYRVSLYDSFYSKLNEGSLMGEGGAIWFPAPFLQVKENPPRDDPYSEGEGTGPQALRPRWLRTTHSRSWEGRRKEGTGLGPGMAQLSQEEWSPLFPSISYKGGSKSGQTACSSPASLEGDKRSFFLRPLSK